MMQAKVSSVSRPTGHIRVTAKALEQNGECSFLPGQYIKLLFKDESGEIKTRSYTLAEGHKSTFSLDIVDHQNMGVAQDWKNSVKVGDIFEFKGPGPAPSFKTAGLSSLSLYIDPSSLPVARAQILGTSQDLENISVFFEGDMSIIRSYIPSEVLEKLQLKTDLEGFLHEIQYGDHCGLWCAGERETINKIRDFIKEKRNEFKSIYISSYWQRGVQDERHRALKKEDRKLIN